MWNLIFICILSIYIFAPMTQLTAGTRTMVPLSSLVTMLGFLAVPLGVTGWLAFGRKQ